MQWLEFWSYRSAWGKRPRLLNDASWQLSEGGCTRLGRLYCWSPDRSNDYQRVIDYSELNPVYSKCTLLHYTDAAKSTRSQNNNTTREAAMTHQHRLRSTRRPRMSATKQTARRPSLDTPGVRYGHHIEMCGDRIWPCETISNKDSRQRQSWMWKIETAMLVS